MKRVLTFTAGLLFLVLSQAVLAEEKLFSTNASDYEIITYQDAGTILQQRLIMKTNPNFVLTHPQNAQFLIVNKTQCIDPAAPARQQVLLCQFILPGAPCVYISEDHVLSCRAYYDLGNLGKGKLLEENDVFYVQVKTIENGVENLLTRSPSYQFSARRLTILPDAEDPETDAGSSSPPADTNPDYSTAGTNNRFAARTRVPVPAVSSGGGSSEGCMHLAGAVTSSRGLWEILCGPWTLIFLFLILIRLSLSSRKRRPGKSFSRSGR